VVAAARFGGGKEGQEINRWCPEPVTLTPRYQWLTSEVGKKMAENFCAKIAILKKRTGEVA
jgi:hypothetical protein